MTFSSLQILLTCVTSGALLLAVSSTSAAQPQEIPLWPTVAPGSEDYQQKEKFDPRGKGIGWITNVSKPTIAVYHPTSENRSGTGVVICPGGGYRGLAIEHEGYALAEWFAKRGIFAAVLKYRHSGPFQHPIPLNDAQRAIRMLRSRAEEWQLKPDQIGIAGFSAGGHLASTVGTRFDKGNPEAKDPIDRASCQANFVVLAYPVITMRVGLTHNGSRNNLLGQSPTKELVKELSNEHQVTDKTSPTFITHAADDPTVPVDNALLFYSALCKKKIPAELHVFEKGGHGYGLFRGDQPVDHWPELLEDWLKLQKLID